MVPSRQSSSAFLVVTLAAAFVGCARRPVAQDCAPSRSTAETPIAGTPSEFTSVGGEIDGARLGALVTCGSPGVDGTYVVLAVGSGPRRLRFQHGAIRCDDGVFRNVDPNHRSCDLAAPAAADDAPVFFDSFLEDVAVAWERSGVPVRASGLLVCKNGEPMLAIGDYAKADRAAAILIERARAWQLGGDLNLAVRGIPGECLL